jgi:hypothetical protein
MTTWPSSNKATTTDIDQGTDSPNLSRAQIKKDIDNINSITDTFDIPTDTPNGSILAYDGRRNKMMDRRLKYDPFGLITDITGDGFQLSEGTYLIHTQSQQSYYITNYGAFGSVQGPSWLGHKIRNIEDDGDSTDNYPARWDTYGDFNDTGAGGAKQFYVFTVPEGQQRKYYLFVDRLSDLSYNFGASTTIGSTNNQRANVVVEITKIGG